MNYRMISGLRSKNPAAQHTPAAPANQLRHTCLENFTYS
jgi:hypothetical protein